MTDRNRSAYTLVATGGEQIDVTLPAPEQCWDPFAAACAMADGLARAMNEPVRVMQNGVKLYTAHGE